MADFSINFAALATANPYTLTTPLATSAGSVWQIVNGTGLKMGSYNGGTAIANSWAYHNVAYGSMISSEITLQNAALSGDNAGACIVIKSGANTDAGYVAIAQSGAIVISLLAANGTITTISSAGGVTWAANDVLKLTYNAATGDLTAYQNGTQIASGNDTTYSSGDRALMSPGWYEEWGNSNGQFISAFAGTGVAAQVIVLGSALRKQRPLGRGPHQGPIARGIRIQRGSITGRSVMLQIFSAPGIPLTNTALNFWTRANEFGAAIDGGASGLSQSTDSNGYVYLQNLVITAGTGMVTCSYPGDTHRSRNFTVVFS